ncbi:MAG: hypothetical protein AB7C97_11570 [Oscillospiraceae bacterium]
MKKRLLFSTVLKRRIIRIISIPLILLLLLSTGGFNVSAASSAEYYDDFESGSQNWDLSEGWKLTKVDGNTILEGVGHTTAVLSEGSWDNYVLKAKLKIISGAIHFNFRRNESNGLNRYFIGIGNDEIYLNKQIGDQFYDLAGASMDLDDGWHDIEIKTYEGIINLYIDDILWAVYNDEIFIESGGVAFETLENSNCLLDEIEITDASADDVIADVKPGQTNVASYLFVPDETHSGDLVLSGTEELVIEDESYLQQGNIYINDEAKLILRNSKLIIGRGELPTIHVYINVGKNATLEIDNSKIYAETVSAGEMGALVCVRNSGNMTMNDSPTNIHLLENYEGGKFTMDNSEMVNPIGGLLQVEGGDIRITNSTFGALGLTVPASADCSVSGLTSGAYFEYWDVHDVIPEADYSVILEKTTILKDDLKGGGYERGWLFFPEPESHLNISDSEIRKVFINIYNDTASFDSLMLGKPSSLEYHDIKLTDVIIRGEWPFEIVDSDVTISNSDFLFLQPGGQSNITLTDSNIIEFIPRDFSGTISFENCTWNDAGEIIGGESYHSMTNDFTMKGSLKIGNDVRQHLQWQDARVTREYDVEITDESGNPLSGLTVKINGQTFVSDENGEVTFSLVFDDTNYNQPEKLQVYNGTNLVFQKDVDFFTETPVILAKAVTAKPINSTVLIDGKPVSFDAYNINGSNYFKLRDLAKALSGSGKQFEVSWDDTLNTIYISTGESYTAVGGELAVSGSNVNKSADLTTSCVCVDAALKKLTAYNIGGNNYFKLRDMAAVINFGVAWDGDTNTINIDTSTGYTKE